MADDNNTENKETFTKEDVQALLTQQQADFDAKLTGTTKKLQDEAAKSRISKDDVFKTIAERLGMDYDPNNKPDKDIFAEKLEGLTSQMKALEEKALNAEKAKTTLEKQTVIKEKASKLGFADANDALKFVDIDDTDIDKTLSDLIVSKVYLLGKKPDIGGGTPPIDANKVIALKQQHEDALKAGDVSLALRLKNKMFKVTK